MGFAARGRASGAGERERRYPTAAGRVVGRLLVIVGVGCGCWLFSEAAAHAEDRTGLASALGRTGEAVAGHHLVGRALVSPEAIIARVARDTPDLLLHATVRPAPRPVDAAVRPVSDGLGAAVRPDPLGAVTVPVAQLVDSIVGALPAVPELPQLPELPEPPALVGAAPPAAAAAVAAPATIGRAVPSSRVLRAGRLHRADEPRGDLGRQPRWVPGPRPPAPPSPVADNGTVPAAGGSHVVPAPAAILDARATAPASRGEYSSLGGTGGPRQRATIPGTSPD